MVQAGQREGAFGGEVWDDGILLDIDEVFAGPEVLLEFGARRRSLRPRFPPYQARADVRTRTINKGIQDTLLQHGLKDHPSAPIYRGEVCCIPFLVIQILVTCMCWWVASDFKCGGAKGSMARRMVHFPSGIVYSWDPSIVCCIF